MRILLTIVLASFLFVSCGKERSFKIKAVNAVTGEVYAGQKYHSRNRLPAGTYIIKIMLGDVTETHKLIVL